MLCGLCGDLVLTQFFRKKEKMGRVFEVQYARRPIRFRFVHNKTASFFGSYISLSSTDEADIQTTPAEIKKAREVLPDESDDAYIEYRVLIGKTSRELLKYNCCIFHAVSFLWRGWAWLLTAPSGTGKTTQYLNWQRLWPNDAEMICGDMPVLESRKDGSIWVHPTSWNGKEGIGSKRYAPLAGIIVLEQGDRNTLFRLHPAESIITCMEQFMVRPETEEEIRSLIEVLGQMIETVPIWKLINLGNEDSTKMIRSIFEKRVLELKGD